MTNFCIAKDATFRVVIPFDVSRPGNPQIIYVPSIEDYPAALQAVKEEVLEYHFCEFRRPAWGEDCIVREQAFSGDSVQNRTFSPERLDEIRVKYFLKATSLIGAEPLNFTNASGYEILSTIAEEKVKRITPFILRSFLATACRVWDLGMSPNSLLQEDDYKLLRDDPEGLKEVAIRKGLYTAEKEAEDKKKSPSAPEKASTPPSSPETTATKVSS